jgi:protocatechuate 3,4-dioxygenase beta subunit
MLGLLGAAGAVAFVGYRPGEGQASQRSVLATNSAGAQPQPCALTPRDIEDPGFVDGMPERSDIRADWADGAMAAGIPLRLLLSVYRVDAGGCSPLPGAQVNIWNCDARGVYSEDQGAGTEGRTFLRGYQVADENGSVEFVTVYPGWYPGRTTHIHFKVRTFLGPVPTFDFTSHLYFDDAISDDVLRMPPYVTKGPKDVSNDRDGFYLNSSADGRVAANMGTQLMLDLSRDDAGYVGRFNIGVAP